eukprot:CAMPEP_0170152828 /NCGR_PEP_ID=MMETSP0033_2-20121228/53645_1 /TAXON_ID=195969 /ORGANISM="Dolichomastix tenuilepis, Strain CCMP3274" /LENGTH=727 /DNA_ID=CAMNT_0010390001 /DNA_START=38 /DNA_END=2221 /DNA_ORIENTATION=+
MSITLAAAIEGGSFGATLLSVGVANLAELPMAKPVRARAELDIALDVDASEVEGIDLLAEEFQRVIEDGELQTQLELRKVEVDAVLSTEATYHLAPPPAPVRDYVRQCDRNDCSVHAECIDLVTDSSSYLGYGIGYVCDCVRGFSGDGLNCVDVDECAVGLDECGPNAVCVNNIGDHSCRCQGGLVTVGDGKGLEGCVPLCNVSIPSLYQARVDALGLQWFPDRQSDDCYQGTSQRFTLMFGQEHLGEVNFAPVYQGTGTRIIVPQLSPDSQYMAYVLSTAVGSVGAVGFSPVAEFKTLDGYLAVGNITTVTVANIGYKGGSLRAKGGGVDVFPGAVTHDVELMLEASTLNPATDARLPRGAISGMPMVFASNFFILKPYHSDFFYDVRLILPFDAGVQDVSARVTLMMLERPTSKRWHDVAAEGGATIDDGTLTMYVRTFGIYAVAYEPNAPPPLRSPPPPPPAPELDIYQLVSLANCTEFNISSVRDHLDKVETWLLFEFLDNCTRDRVAADLERAGSDDEDGLLDLTSMQQILFFGVGGFAVLSFAGVGLVMVKVNALKKAMLVKPAEEDKAGEGEEGGEEVPDPSATPAGYKVAFDKRLFAQRKKQEAKNAFMRESYAEAITLFTEAIGADPLDPENFSLRSSAYAALAAVQEQVSGAYKAAKLGTLKVKPGQAPASAKSVTFAGGGGGGANAANAAAGGRPDDSDDDDDIPLFQHPLLEGGQ